MIDAELLKTRILCAEDYLKGLESVRRIGWIDSLLLFKKGELTAPHAMALIHPEHYDYAQEAVCGARTFIDDPAPSLRRCECHLYWQIACPFEGLTDFSADHVFPYSLGGPTEPNNRMVLCRLHNQMKSNDVHFYPWERGQPSWLEPVVRRIELQRNQQWR